MNKLKPCPFCGKIPEINDYGSELSIECCFSIGFQKCDELSIEQRGTWDNSTYKHSYEVEEYLREVLIKRYNTRVDNSWISVKDRLPEDDDIVNIKYASGLFGYGWYCSEDNSWYYDTEDDDIIKGITHWQSPVPEDEGYEIL